MRTNIEIDDKLMKEAMKASGAATKKAVVEQALLMLVKSYAQQRIWRWSGKVEWDGPSKADQFKDKWQEAEMRDRLAGNSRKKAA